MHIFVRSSSGSKSVDVSPSASASDLIRILLPDSSHKDFYLSHGGKLLGYGRTLADSGIREHSTLQLGIRLLGGGGDGGATGAESRDCYLKMYADKKPDKVDPNEARLAKWTRCALSSEALTPPCVVDVLGNVYNKEAVVHALLTKSLPKKFNHIKGLKDLTNIELASIPGVGEDAETKFQCPITGQEFNGKFKFLALKKCGHVLSLRAFKEVQSSSCLVCYADFTEEDKLLLNGTDDEVSALREKMEAQKASRIQAKKGIKEKNGDVNGINGKAGENKRKGDEEAVLKVKKVKTTIHVPSKATSDVYKSIFTSSGSKNKIQETYSCRALPLGRN